MYYFAIVWYVELTSTSKSTYVKHTIRAAIHNPRQPLTTKMNTVGLSAFLDRHKLEGLGLFAGRNYKAGEVVEHMDARRQRKMSPSEWEAFYEARGVPHDAIIGRYTDVTSVRLPGWYRLNHSLVSANLDRPEMRNGVVMWVALRNIKVGEELLFNYGHAPRFVDDVAGVAVE